MLATVIPFDHPAFIVFAVSCGALLLIWLGYPALMIILARIAPRPARAGLPTDRSSWPSVTAVLATRDDAGVILERIRNLLASDYPAERLDVVVALDAQGAACTPDSLVAAFASDSHVAAFTSDSLVAASTSDSRSITGIRDSESDARNTGGDSGDLSRVRIVAGDEPGGKAAALNAGVRAANGDVLMLMDSRQRYEADTVQLLVSALNDSDVGAVSGALTLGRDGASSSPVHLYWALEKKLRRAEALRHSAIGVTGAVYATRRALWPVVPAGTILDDVFVPMALVMQGYRIGFEPAARATDVRSFDARAEQTRKARTLTGVLQLCRLLPGILLPWRNPVWAQFVAHKLLRLLSPLLVVGMLTGFVWSLVVIGRAAPLSTAVLLAACATVVLAVAPLRRTVFSIARWAFAMQVAIVGALLNGVRGRWQVWTRAK